MTKHYRLLFWALMLLCSCGETKKPNSETAKLNVDLKRQLEEIFLRDQGIREIVEGNLSEERKAVLLNELGLQQADIEGAGKFELMKEIDSVNLQKVEKIIKEYGYPGKSIVGEPANKAVYYVIQHSDKIDEYIPLIRKAAEHGDIPKTLLAMMEDRNLMNNGQEQIYGTQIKGQANKKGQWVYVLWPIKNADSINIWRKEVGFEQRVEEYVKAMGVEYRLYSIAELDSL